MTMPTCPRCGRAAEHGDVVRVVQLASTTGRLWLEHLACPAAVSGPLTGR